MTERELFIAALDIEDMAARQSFLTQSCAGDSQLRKRVEALLASLETGGEFMQTPVMEQLGECEVSELNTTILLGAGSTVEKSPLTEITIASDLTGAIGSEDQLSEDIPAECLTTATRPDSLGRLAHYEIPWLPDKDFYRKRAQRPKFGTKMSWLFMPSKNSRFRFSS